MNPGRLFRRENIKAYEYLWVVLGAVVATAVYDVSKPEHDAKWCFLLLGTGWASICSFNIYVSLDEKWQRALRNFEDALHAYDEESFSKEEIAKLRVWFCATVLSAITALIACFVL